MNEKAREILNELFEHQFANCGCQSAVEHVRWVEGKIKELREALK